MEFPAVTTDRIKQVLHSLELISQETNQGLVVLMNNTTFLLSCDQVLLTVQAAWKGVSTNPAERADLVAAAAELNQTTLAVRHCVVGTGDKDNPLVVTLTVETPIVEGLADPQLLSALEGSFGTIRRCADRLDQRFPHLVTWNA